jgi:GT2 family glycosyltransferase
VPAHDADATLGRQLHALATQIDPPPYEVILVLNRCTSATRAVAETYLASMPLRVVDADRLLSASYARNVGAEMSVAPYVLFCDADDVVGARWIAELAGALDDGRVDFVGGATSVDRDGLPQWAYDRYYAAIDGPRLAHMPPGTWFPIGASLGVRRDVFRSVGGFDEGFPGTGFEEVELARRLYRRGARVGIAPEARYVYRPRRAFRALMQQRRRYARGFAFLAAKEGRPLYRPRTLERVRHLARVAGGAIRHRRSRNPADFVASLLEQWFRYDANWEFGRASMRAPDTDEFVVPIGVPLIDGLAVEALIGPGGVEEWFTEGSVETTTVALLEQLAAPGDVVVDLHAGVGAFAVAAALRTGPDGRVIAREPEARTRALLGSNVIRHRVADRVGVSDGEHGDGLLADGARLVRVQDRSLADVRAATHALLATSADTALLIGVSSGGLRDAWTTLRGAVRPGDPENWDVWLIGAALDSSRDPVRIDESVDDVVATRPPSWSGVVVVVPRKRECVLADPRRPLS